MAENLNTNDRVFIGIGLGLTAFFMFAVMNAAAKLLTDTHHVIEISFYRGIIAAIPFLIYIFAKKRTDLFKVKHPALLSARVCIGTFGMVITIGAMKYMPMADATLIFLSATLITPAMAFFFLKEDMGWRRWAAIIIGMFGVAFVVQPTGQVQLIGTIMACGAACTHSMIQVLLRALKGESGLTITLYFLVGGTLLLAPFMPLIATPFTDPYEILLLLFVGLSGGIGQFALSYAFKFAPASTISPFNFSGLLWATFFDILIWSYIPGWPVFLGAAMMLGAKLYILNRERIHARKSA